MSPLFAATEIGGVVWIIGLFVILILLLILLAVFAKYFRLWIQSVTTGAQIGIWDLIGMSFRKVRPEVIVRSKIMAVQAGLNEETGRPIINNESYYGTQSIPIAPGPGGAPPPVADVAEPAAGRVEYELRNIVFA